MPESSDRTCPRGRGRRNDYRDAQRTPSFRLCASQEAGWPELCRWRGLSEVEEDQAPGPVHRRRFRRAACRGLSSAPAAPDLMRVLLDTHVALGLLRKSLTKQYPKIA